MTDFPIKASPGDDETITVTLDPAGLVAQFAELCADDDEVVDRFEAAVMVMRLLRLNMDVPVRDVWEAKRAGHLRWLAESPAVRSALTAVLTVPQGTTLSNVVDDAVGRVIEARGIDLDEELTYDPFVRDQSYQEDWR